MQSLFRCRTWLPAMAFFLTLLALFPFGVAKAAERNQFRGPEGNGVYANLSLPLEWSVDAIGEAGSGEDESGAAAKDVVPPSVQVWRTEVEGTGWSSPIVAGGKVFVTSAFAEGQPKPKDMASGARDMASIPLLGTPQPPKNAFQFRLTCLDAENGKILWTTSVAEQTPAISIHPSNTFATESPAVLGERVFVFFGTIGTLAAYDFSGVELWRREIEPQSMSAGFGTGSSLAVDDERLYLQRDNEKASSLSAIDPASGETIWTAQRKSGSSWATPFVWRNSRRTEIVAAGSGGAVAYDPRTGAELWRFGGLPSSASASPTAYGDLIFFGTSGPFSNSPLVAVRAGAEGDVSLSSGERSGEFVAWKKNGSGLGMASPIAVDGVLYVAESGLVRALDVETGEELFAERLDGAKTFAASLWSAGGKIFLLDEAGTTFALKAGRSFELLAKSPLKETVWSTPCTDGDSLVIRGVNAVYGIRNPSR